MGFHLHHWSAPVELGAVFLLAPQSSPERATDHALELMTPLVVQALLVFVEKSSLKTVCAIPFKP